MGKPKQLLRVALLFVAFVKRYKLKRRIKGEVRLRNVNVNVNDDEHEHTPKVSITTARLLVAPDINAPNNKNRQQTKTKVMVRVATKQQQERARKVLEVSNVQLQQHSVKRRIMEQQGIITGGEIAIAATPSEIISTRSNSSRNNTTEYYTAISSDSSITSNHRNSHQET